MSEDYERPVYHCGAEDCCEGARYPDCQFEGFQERVVLPWPVADHQGEAV